MTDFYFRYRHLFEEDDDQIYSSKMQRLYDMIPKSNNNINYPKVFIRERTLPQESQKTIFTQNANMLFGSVHNNKFLRMDDKHAPANNSNLFKEPPPPRASSNIENLRKAPSPSKANNSQNMHCVLNHMTSSSVHKEISKEVQQERSWTQKIERKSFFSHDQRNDIQSLYGVLRKNIEAFVPPAGYKKPEFVTPHSRNIMEIMKKNNEQFFQPKSNIGLQPINLQSSWANSDRNKRDISAPPLRERARDKKRESSMKLGESALKITDIDPVNETKKAFTFPLDDYQALKRKLGIRSDLTTSEKSPFPNNKSRLPFSREARLSELQIMRGRRNVPKALERRLLTALDPTRKERLKALMKKDRVI